jgi:uncharacterized protein
LILRDLVLFSGILFLQIKIPAAATLKDRRQVTRSIQERARARFNVSVADLGPDGVCQDAFLVFETVSSSLEATEERILSLERMIRSMENKGDFFIVRDHREVESRAWFQN